MINFAFSYIQSTLGNKTGGQNPNWSVFPSGDIALLIVTGGEKKTTNKHVFTLYSGLGAECTIRHHSMRSTQDLESLFWTIMSGKQFYIEEKLHLCN